MLNFNKDGLIIAIAQDYKTGVILMQAYMNKESLEQTIATKKATYFSRSRGKLWVKGEESGHFQYVKDILIDCDGDCILLKVEQVGAACHTNNYSCFYRDIDGYDYDVGYDPSPNVLYEVYDVICDRHDTPKEGSYTNYLFEKGIDKICKKIGEEATETIIAAKNLDGDDMAYEISDLLFHLMVLMKEVGITPDDVFKELKKRR